MPLLEETKAGLRRDGPLLAMREVAGRTVHMPRRDSNEQVPGPGPAIRLLLETAGEGAGSAMMVIAGILVVWFVMFWLVKTDPREL